MRMETSQSSTLAPAETGEETVETGNHLVTERGAATAAALAESVVPAAFGVLPMQLDVAVPIRGFRVRDLLHLEKGTVIASEWPHDEDLPIWCGGAQLVWTEFEVVDDVLAVRVTRVL
ncbi:FliM/FliN family flagellar motor C-terminal domain-containing protein [Silvibacterium dinghuense]|uniref:FliM/FliN family flagellar motor C-terminal domain-containing protein n=1 Tax=Silvibacterium dinghuense TaxID=1560006 RepID=UPI001E54E090|nr:FliM/FliN family flagellar motor C-terminal domain-containing protein [Silvibacterium dinghuense]